MANAGSTLNQHRVVRYDPITPEGWNALRAAILDLYDGVEAVAERLPNSLFVVVRDGVTGKTVPAAWIQAVSAAPADHPETPLPPGIRVGDRYLIADPAPGSYVVTVEPRPGAGYLEASEATTLAEGLPAVVDIELERAVDRRQVPESFGVRFFGVRDRLQAADLQVGQVMDTHGHTLEAADWPRFDEQLVISTEPGSGAAVLAGTAVDLLLAALPFPRFPSLLGQSLAAARALATGFAETYRLELAGIEVAEREQAGGDGTVAEQVPIAGAEIFAASLEVKLAVSAPLRTGVPTLIGVHVDDVSGLLADAQLVLGQVGTQPTSVPADHQRVAEQRPLAGERVLPGSRVDVVIWEHPHVAVPEVVGLGRAEAETALAEAGLAPRVVEQATGDVALDGVVAAQEPAAGRVVPAGSQVQITCWRFPRATVPELVGLALGAAGELLAQAGLVLASPVTEQPTENAALDSTVAAQDPQVGTEVLAGSEVQVTIWRLRMVTVPDVLGLPLDAAFELLQDAELTPAEGTFQSTQDPALNGRVAGQEPSAGAEVPASSAVRLDVWQVTETIVPNLLGRPKDEASAMVAEAGLRLSTTGEPTVDATLFQRVTRQQPKPGDSVPAGGIVAVVLGVEARFPELTCALGEEAGDLIRRFVDDYAIRWDGAIGVVNVPSDGKADSIAGQTPGTGELVGPELSGVALRVRRPAFPDVRCLNADNANEVIRAWIGENGLDLADVRITRLPSMRETGTVLAQSPAALSADYEPRELVVGLTVAAKRSRPLDGLPEVLCLTADEAASAIRAYGAQHGLTIAIRQRGAASQRPDGIVLDQSPAPGTTLGPGATVTLAVSRPPMPDVVCLNADEAQQMIKRAAGDRAVSFTMRSTPSTIERGAVVAQSPAAGAALPALGQALAVTLVVSEGLGRVPLGPMIDLQKVAGIGPARATQLQAAGIADAAGLAQASVAEIAAILGVGEAVAEKLIGNAKVVVG